MVIADQADGDNFNCCCLCRRCYWRCCGWWNCRICQLPRFQRHLFRPQCWNYVLRFTSRNCPENKDCWEILSKLMSPSAFCFISEPLFTSRHLGAVGVQVYTTRTEVASVHNRSLTLDSFSFSSRWHRSARKGPYALRPVSQQSPQGCLRNSANICLVEHWSFSTLEGGMSAASFLHSSFLQAVNAVMFWPVHVEKVPQASEHLCPVKPQTRCDICCACQSICPFSPTDSGVSRTVNDRNTLSRMLLLESFLDISWYDDGDDKADADRLWCVKRISLTWTLKFLIF